MWISARRAIWFSSIPTAIGLVAAGLAIEPSRASMYLYVASVLCAGATVVRFIVNDLAPSETFESERRRSDVQPNVTTTRAIKI